jgi:pre-mRNA 3'-end-processing factor FIP1
MDDEDDDLYGPSESPVPAEQHKAANANNESDDDDGDEPMDEGEESGETDDDDDDESDSVGRLSPASSPNCS